jgi:hypothetical protein
MSITTGYAGGDGKTAPSRDDFPPMQVCNHDTGDTYMPAAMIVINGLLFLVNLAVALAVILRL